MKKRKNESGAQSSASTDGKQSEKVHGKETLVVETPREKLDRLRDQVNQHAGLFGDIIAECLEAAKAVRTTSPGDGLATASRPEVQPFGPVEPQNETIDARWHVLETFQHCLKMKWEDGLLALYNLGMAIRSNPELQTEGKAMEAFGNAHDAFQGVDNRYSTGKCLTGAETWMARRLDSDAALEVVLRIAGEVELMLADNPKNEPLLDTVGQLRWAVEVMKKLEKSLSN